MKSKKSKNKKAKFSISKRINEFFIRLDIRRALLGKRRFLHWDNEKNHAENVVAKLAKVRAELSLAYGPGKEEKQPSVNAEQIPGSDNIPLSDIGDDDLRLKTISQIEKESKYKREYLGYLIRQKKIKARKIDGTWKTTLAWVREFEKKTAARKEQNKKELSRRMIGESISEKLVRYAQGNFERFGEKILSSGIIGKTGGQKIRTALQTANENFSAIKNRFVRSRKRARENWREQREEIRKMLTRKEVAKQLAALGILLVLITAANVTGGDLVDWKDKSAQKFLLGYNGTLQSISEKTKVFNGSLAQSISAVKVGTAKIDDFTNAIIGRKKIRDFEKSTGLTLTGQENAKQDFAEKESGTFGEGTVAGEESSRDEEQRSALGSQGGRVLAVTDNVNVKENPGDIEVSAYLLNADNREIPNGNYEIRFCLYTADRTENDPYPSDTDQASRVWEETQNLNVTSGMLSTYLGQIKQIPASLNFGSKMYYLGIRVGEDAELLPRKRIGAVPLARFALNALSANSVSGYTIGTSSGNIPVSNGTLAANLNADLLDGKHASAFMPAGTTLTGDYDNYQSWKLQASSADPGQQIKTKKGAIFVGGGGITTSRDLSTLTISMDFGSAEGTAAEGSTPIIVSTTGNLSGGGTGTAGGGLNLTLDTVTNPTFTDLTLSSPLTVSSGGTGAGTFTQYGVIYGNLTSALQVTAAGTEGQVLMAHTGAAPTWSDTAPAAPHALLSAFHPDTTGAAVQKGDLIAGLGDAPNTKWTRLGIGSASQVLTVSAGVPIWADIPAKAPVNAQYVTLGLDPTLTTERVLTGTGDQVILTDTGPNGTIILSTPQNIHAGATPTFAGLTLSGFTPNYPVITTAGGQLTTEQYLSVARGGTGVGTFTQYGVIYGNLTSALQVTGAGTEGQVLMAHNGAAPTWSDTALAAPHALLSAYHLDTTGAAVQKGDLITGQGDAPGTTWSRLAIGDSGQVLISSGGVPTWADTAIGAPHALLSGSHSDTTGAAVQKGDLITGQGDSPTWSRLGIGSAGEVLTVSAGVPVWSPIGTAGAVAWSGLDDPVIDLSLSMSAFTTTMNWNAATGASNLFNFTDTLNNTGTGYLLNLATASGSTLKPFHVSSAGTEALTVIANGNVGIGTTTPGAKLEIQQANDSTGLRIRGATASTEYLDIWNNNGASGNDFHVSTTGNLRFDIEPYFEEGAFVHDGKLVTFQNTLGGNTYSIGRYAADDTFRIAMNGDLTTAPRITLTNTGRVGIGTTDPQNTMHVNGSIEIGTGLSNTGLYTYNAARDQYGSLELYDLATGNVTLKTTLATGNILLLPGSSGKVGVGTSNPQSKLNIDGGVGSLATGLTFGDGDTGFYESSDDSMYITLGGNNHWLLNAGNFFAANGNAAGMVDISTSSTAPTILPRNNDPNTGVGSSIADTLSLIAGGVNVANAENTGYFGIGAADPSYRLHVTGADAQYIGYFYNTSTNAAAGGLYVRSDGTGSLLTLNYAGSNVVDITQAQSTFYNPVNFAGTGDVSLAYDLYMTNTTAGYIKFNGPGYIQTESPADNLDLTLSAANSGYVVVADTLQLDMVSTATTGATEYGYYGTIADTGVVTSGTDTTYGNYLSVTRTGATGGTINTYGQYISLTADNAGGGTSTVYGLYVDTTGSTADTTYSSVFMGGNVGIGTTAPANKLEISSPVGTVPMLRLSYDASTYAGLGYDAAGSTHFWMGNAYNNNSATMEFRMKGLDSAKTVMTILGSGNVGIGTTTPGAKLDVNGDIYVNSSLYVNNINSDAYFSRRVAAVTNKNTYIWSNSGQSSDTIGGANITLQSINTAGGAVNDGALILYAYGIGSGADANSIIFRNRGNADSSSERMRITSGGNVGIGTTTPNYKLSLGSTGDQIGFYSDATHNAYITPYQATTANMVFSMTNATATSGYFFQAGGNDLVKIAYGGNVGIGTTTPGQKLHVVGQSIFANGGSNIQIYSADSATLVGKISNEDVGTGTNGLTLYSNTGRDLTLGAGGVSNYLIVKNTSGNVGIGTTAPGAKLHILDTAPELRIASSDSLNDPAILLARNSAPGSIAGKIWLDNSTADIYIDNLYDNTAGDIYFRTRASGTPVDALTILGGGSIGIGTTAPGAKLDIVNTATVGASIRLREGTDNGTNFISFKAPDSLAANNTYTWPSDYGTNNYVLTTNGAGGLSWAASASTGMSDPMTTAGDMIYRNTSNVTDRLAIGTAGQILTVTDVGGTLVPRWAAAAAGLTVGGDDSPTGQIQYRSAGNFAANDYFYLDPTNYELYVIGSKAGAKNLYLQNTSNGTASSSGINLGNDLAADEFSLKINSSTFTGAANYAYVWQKADAPLIFGTNNATAMTIISGGNVGIGTTAPNQALEISHATIPTLRLNRNDTNIALGELYGRIEAYGNDTQAAGVAGSLRFVSTAAVLDAASYNSRFIVATTRAGTETDAFAVDSNGYVGIGTTAPEALLTMRGTDPVFNIGDDNATRAEIGWLSSTDTLFIQTSIALTYTGNLTLQQNGGKVGIGTTSPNKLLEIVGGATGAETGVLQLRSNFVTTNTATTLKFVNSTDPAASTGSGEIGVLRNASSSGEMIFRTYYSGAMNETMRMVSGNVGIGTTAPNRKLEVNGSIRMGALIAGGGSAVAVYRDANGDLADATSSIQYKTAVEDMEPVLSRIMNLRAVRFDWNDQTSTPGMADFGMIAEEVNGVFPELVTLNPDGTPRGLKYEKMGVFALKGLQEQQNLITQNSQRVTQVDLKIDNATQSTAELQTAINDKLNIISQSLALGEANSLALGGRVSETEAKLSAAEEKFQTDENNLATFQTSTNDTLTAMLETDNLLTQRVADHEDRLEYLEAKMSAMTIMAGGEIPDNVLVQDKNGNAALAGIFEAKGVVAGSYAVKSDDPEKKTMGEETINSGENEKRIETNAISSSAKIFVTFESDPGARFWTEKTKDPDTGEYTGFVIKLSESAKNDVKASWWVVESLPR